MDEVWWEVDELVADVSVGWLLVGWYVALLLDVLYGELSFCELLEDELEVEEAWSVEGLDVWSDGLVVVVEDGWVLEPSVGMARSPLACHLPQSAG